MAQGSRFVAPKFNGPGLFDPRVPGRAYPEPKEGVPYVQGVAGVGGCSACGGMGSTNPSVAATALKMQHVNIRDQYLQDLTVPVAAAPKTAAPPPPAAPKKKPPYALIAGTVVGLALITWVATR